MLIGETPGDLEDNSGYSFQGNVGELLKKMLLAINVKKEKIYTAYSINFRPPDDRKPTSKEIKRYSIFIKIDDFDLFLLENVLRGSQESSGALQLHLKN